VVALELDGDRLDQRIVLVGVLDPAPDRLDELEELVGVHLVVADEEDVGEDLLVALVELVEEHAGSDRDGEAMDRKYTVGPRPGPIGDRDRATRARPRRAPPPRSSSWGGVARRRRRRSPRAGGSAAASRTARSTVARLGLPTGP
jgi:hypothetical protein